LNFHIILDSQQIDSVKYGIEAIFEADNVDFALLVSTNFAKETKSTITLESTRCDSGGKIFTVFLVNNYATGKINIKYAELFRVSSDSGDNQLVNIPRNAKRVRYFL